jgi:hypothetical protein
MAKADAERQLRAWVEDLLTGDHTVLLPIEAALACWGRQTLTAESVREFLEKEQESGARSYVGTLTGAVPDPMRFEPPGDPQRVLEGRLKPFLDLVYDPGHLELV